jgi:hypothetical protein
MARTNGDTLTKLGRAPAKIQTVFFIISFIFSAKIENIPVILGYLKENIYICSDNY